MIPLKVSQTKFDGKAAVYYRKCIPYPRNPVKVEIIANNVWASCMLTANCVLPDMNVTKLLMLKASDGNLMDFIRNKKKHGPV